MDVERPGVQMVESFDSIGATAAGCADAFGLARVESMDVVNDPRFFASSVMDKRLGAFKSLTIVSGLMFGVSLKQTFTLKKDMDFSKIDPLVGNIGVWQLVGFFISMIVTNFCLFSLYIIAHQLFYTTRLMTAGPTGFEQACVFYLTKTITMWRHLAIKCLFKGLQLFMLLIGIQLFVTFYKDANSAVLKPKVAYFANVVGGTSQQDETVDTKWLTHKEHKLDMLVHSILAYVVFVLYVIATYALCLIRKQHLTVFQKNYEESKPKTDALEKTLHKMSHRAAHLLET
jgi:hypothetical protein